MHVENIKNKDGDILGYLVVDNNGNEVKIISEFISYLRVKNYSPNTLKNYTYDLRYCFEYFETINKSYLEVKPKDLIGLVEYLTDKKCKGKADNVIRITDVAEGKTKAGGLSPKTINRIMATLSSFFDWVNLVDDNYSGTPLPEITDYRAVPVSDSYKGLLSFTKKKNKMSSRFLKIKVPKALPRPLSDEQVQAIINGVHSNRDKAMLLLAFRGGLRIGEILGLTFEDINFSKREIAIRFRDDNPNGSRVKGSKDRIVQIYEDDALSILNEYILYERPESDSEYIFLSNKGSTKGCPLSYQGARTVFNYHCKKNGIKVVGDSVTIHSLRHTHATNMYENGMSLLTLQKRLGHASPSSTQVYTKISNTQVKEEYQNAVNNSSQKSSD